MEPLSIPFALDPGPAVAPYPPSGLESLSVPVHGYDALAAYGHRSARAHAALAPYVDAGRRDDAATAALVHDDVQAAVRAVTGRGDDVLLGAAVYRNRRGIR